MGLVASYLRGLLPRTAAQAPTTVVPRAGVRVDPAHLLRYARVCGFTLTGPLPPTYPHLLGFGPALTLMADRTFPFRLPGLVHTGQVITWYRPIAVDEVLDVEVSAGNLATHPRGATIDVVTRVCADGDEVWLGRSTYLRRGARAAGSPDESAVDAEAATATATRRTDSSGHAAAPGSEPVPGTDPAPGSEPVPASACWRLPAGLGRRYAAVSGDRNPIHLSAATARAFGFRTAIAHGMWSAARCLAALDGRLPERGEATVSFRRPVRLPGRVGFAARIGAEATTFTLVDPADRLLVAGRVTDLP